MSNLAATEPSVAKLAERVWNELSGSTHTNCPCCSLPNSLSAPSRNSCDAATSEIAPAVVAA
eukprot:832266-Rhodomonas_salina.1